MYHPVVPKGASRDPDRLKRLTLDLPADLHRALKIRSAELEVPMVELLRRLIERSLREPAGLVEVARGLGGGQP